MLSIYLMFEMYHKIFNEKFHNLKFFILYFIFHSSQRYIIPFITILLFVGRISSSEQLNSSIVDGHPASPSKTYISIELYARKLLKQYNTKKHTEAKHHFWGTIIFRCVSMANTLTKKKTRWVIWTLLWRSHHRSNYDCKRCSLCWNLHIWMFYSLEYFKLSILLPYFWSIKILSRLFLACHIFTFKTHYFWIVVDIIRLLFI